MVKTMFLTKALWVAGAALAIDIPDTPVWPTASCTDKSLTIPSWVISKYKVVGGVTTFRVDNRASTSTGLIADQTCQSDGSCQGTGNDELRASITQSDGGPVVTLSELWVCRDTGDTVIFNASGKTTITQCAGSDCVSPITYLVSGGYKLPVPVTPTQPTPPPGFDATACADVGDKQWTVTEVSYEKYTKGQCKQWYNPDYICLNPTNGWKAKGEYINLKVTNNAISHDVTCSFTPKPGSTSPPQPLRCTGGDFNEITLDVSWTGSAPDFTLKVEELWYCLENPKTNVAPSVIVASGSTSVKLDCATSTGVTGTDDDIVTICKDSSEGHSIDGTQNAKKSLPAFSLVTANPVHGGCTYDSVVNPTFYQRGLYFATNQFPSGEHDKATLKSFTCGLTGPGFADYFFYANNPLSGSGVDAVYNCNSYVDGKPVQDHWNCTYSFEPFDKVLTLDKVWKCDDKDKANPLYFNGVGSYDWKVDPYYSCSSTDTSESCLWHDSLALLQPGIPYDIPKVTVSTEYVAPLSVQTMRKTGGNWTIVDNGKSS